MQIMNVLNAISQAFALLAAANLTNVIFRNCSYPTCRLPSELTAIFLVPGTRRKFVVGLITLST